MLTGWRYRIVSLLGVVGLTVGAVASANHPFTQSLVTTYVPLFNRLEPTLVTGGELYWMLGLSVLAVTLCLLPLYRPRPQRILDTVALTHKRVIVAGLALASLGYFNWSLRFPRATLITIIGLLGVALPAWFVWIRRPPNGEPGRTLFVGDDIAQLERIAPTVDAPVLGYLCPSSVGFHTFDEDEIDDAGEAGTGANAVTDGGLALETVESDGRDGVTHLSAGSQKIAGYPRLGGLSRLEDVLVERDIDTVVLAFRHADRAEFFGALDACHEHGVSAKVHREYTDSVLVSEGAVGELVDVDLEPWDPLDYLCKRLFDVVFALVGLLVFAPLMAVIAAVIKIDSPGPVFYSQDRTAGFGETFPIYKFRTMIPEGEDATPTEDEDNDRITRVGRVLRKTHLDELPQLWSIFVGDMSVVGPRAVWTQEEVLLEQDAPSWRKRWFVKPGLTGLAQIHDASSTDPSAKLRYDLEYIRRQSFWVDLSIVIRQIWAVLEDVWTMVRR
ncbi:sugar transferase [Natronorubrum daqingense]|uniref:Exopolysaccharide biosynthesis polyprenyl glycosylphosphotransferase n=1 Tax=Natronorubrum daqingense TaxID=588898 RepID=A0A1N7BTZ3_9EURY|nr:sugar transferase [Natronorubrum daqingense]APX96598.1 exopolysaccharide biosynthesis polyprenyl glycosylphosphotransferase [Natronorubrum daqingense]SIR54829.1 Sugar transferase involved in LPS biosynthesis (colanic, teichoic acid) [Natronorubrum daqingense]